MVKETQSTVLCIWTGLKDGRGRKWCLKVCGEVNSWGWTAFYLSDFFYGKLIRNLFCQNNKTLQEKCSEKLYVNNMTFVARLSAQYELDTKKKKEKTVDCCVWWSANSKLFKYVSLRCICVFVVSLVVDWLILCSHKEIERNHPGIDPVHVIL